MCNVKWLLINSVWMFECLRRFIEDNIFVLTANFIGREVAQRERAIESELTKKRERESELAKEREKEMDRESPSNHLYNFFCVFYLYTWNDLNTQLYNIQAKAILLLSIYRIGFQRVEWNVWANERASKHTSNLLQKHNTKGNSLWRSNLNVVHCDHNVSSGVCFTLVAFVPWIFFFAHRKWNLPCLNYKNFLHLLQFRVVLFGLNLLVYPHLTNTLSFVCLRCRMVPKEEERFSSIFMRTEKATI